jgi:hypothetical protein
MSEVKVNKISPRTNCGTTQLGDAGDTITVTGDLKSNSLKSASGSTITLGQSGDTIQLGCGATQTGFGRTGTVDWDTTAKTASFTAVSGNGYFVNTTSGAITVTMPASPSAGDIVGIKDYAGTFATNNVTVGRNGSNFDGVATDPTLSTNQLSVFFVYIDGTQGWKATQSDSGEYGSLYVTATGGTITCCGDYKIHTFTGPGTFCVSCGGNAVGSNTVDYLVIAGGGGGGTWVGGGGGAGGFRESKAPTAPWTASPLATCASLPVTAQGYPITVGGGGATLVAGSNSIFSSITSAGGGHGASYTSGNPGGSGGGGGGGSPSGPYSGGTGNTPPVSPPQGNNGGTGYIQPGVVQVGGGGGGAGAVGSNAPTGASGGPGGNGVTTSINGSSVTRAGGGGGAADEPPSNSHSTGGSGGGGRGSYNPAPVNTKTAGTVNTGSGGGGGGPGGCGSGGSGIVIIRYKYQ